MFYIRGSLVADWKAVVPYILSRSEIHKITVFQFGFLNLIADNAKWVSNKM